LVRSRRPRRSMLPSLRPRTSAARSRWCSKCIGQEERLTFYVLNNVQRDRLLPIYIYKSMQMLLA
jgi:hypothetical protein